MGRIPQSTVQRSPRVRVRERGLTLVEVAIACTVMALAITGMIQVVTNGSEMIDTAQKQTVAQQIIQSEIEQIRLSTWSTISSLSTSFTYRVRVDAAGSSASDDNTTNGVNDLNFFFLDNSTALLGVARNFTCAFTVSTVRTDLRRIDYTVTWVGITGRTQTRTGFTYLGKNGLHASYQRS